MVICFRECRVVWADGAFRWLDADLQAGALARHVEEILGSLDDGLAQGYVSEGAPARQEFVGEVGAGLEEGGARFCEYG